MEAQARAGIDFYGSVLRYAEVEQYGSRYRLLRLGSCDFDFDVTQDVLYGADEAHLETVAEALSDVFAGSVSNHLHVAVHPPGCYSLFTPVPAGLPEQERQERLRQELALLTEAGEAAPGLRYRADALYSEALPGGEQAEWYHVLATDEQLNARFERVLTMLAQAGFRLQLSMHGAAAVIDYLENRLEDGAGRRRAAFSVAIGWYGTHVEYTVCRQGRWRFSHHTPPQAPVDCAYFTIQLLQRLGAAPADVAHLYLYGVDVALPAFAFLKDLFRIEPERLNPMRVVELDPDNLSSSFDAEAYVPCIGVAL